jgi:hypothetical protein
MNVVSVSFEIGDKTVTVRREIETGLQVREALSALLKEIDEVGQPGKASPAQLRALYARAFAAGWEKQKVKELLENKLGTSSRDKIVGVVEWKDLSRLIDEIGPAPEVPGKATANQMRALWAKALNKGWERERVRAFLQEKVGASQDAQIVGRIDKQLVSTVIDEIAAA